jgi:hypothetical protein
VILGLSLSLAWAQDKKAPPAAAKKMPPMDMTAKQSPEMAKLTKMFVGSWVADEKFEAVPEMGPEAVAGTGKGTEVVKAGPAGNSLIADFKARSTMGPFSGHGVIWWDAKAGVYRSLWCDSETPGSCEAGATGKWEGNDLVFSVNSEMPGPKGSVKFKMRQVYSEMKPASFTFYIDASVNGGAMKRMMTIKYKK